MGTHYVREICQIFKEVAEKSQFPDTGAKLAALADELLPLAKKLYFKTQKGTEDMQELTSQAGDLASKMAACQTEQEAEAVCQPYFDMLGKTIKHVKTMKVRMT